MAAPKRWGGKSGEVRLTPRAAVPNPCIFQVEVEGSSLPSEEGDTMMHLVIGHTCPKACRRTLFRVHLNPLAAIEDPRIIEIGGRVGTLSPEEHNQVVIRIKSHARKAPHRRAFRRGGE